MMKKRHFPIHLIGNPNSFMYIHKARKLKQDCPSLIMFRYQSKRCGKYSTAIFFKEDFVLAWKRINKQLRGTKRLRSMRLLDFLNVLGFRKYIPNGYIKNGDIDKTLEELEEALMRRFIINCEHSEMRTHCWHCFRASVIYERAKQEK